MHRTPRVLLSVLAVIGALTPLHALGPASSGLRQAAYLMIAGSAVVIGYLGVRHHRPDRRIGWYLLLAGCVGWGLGDLFWAAEQGFLPAFAPLARTPLALSDGVYLIAYLLLGAGALSFTRARSNLRDPAALLDAAIVTTGVAVLVGVFLIAPMTSEAGPGTGQKLIGVAYPLIDLFLLGVLTRTYSAVGSRTSAYRLLAGALLLALTADTMHGVAALSPGGRDMSRWTDTLWLLCYLLIAAAACVPSMTEPDAPGPDRSAVIPPRSRMVILTASLILPGLALLLDGYIGGGTHWLVVGIGTLVLSTLVSLRMDGLLTIVKVQAERLAAMARSDALTGAPNRRTWDHELPLACRRSAQRGTPLSVAIIDLDQFKIYNDTYGHPAGDRLLRAAALAWADALPAEALLARYGGEEFAVLLPGVDAVELARLIQQLRVVTPAGQTFSAGVARWDPATEPEVAVAGADEALYAAKHAGRDRVFVHGQARAAVAADPSLPVFTMLTQPIVDLASSSVSAHEALARFHGPQSRVEVLQVFRRARAGGYGDLLELATVRAALDLPGRPADQDLFVNVSARAITSQRFLGGLPDRLDGVVIELSEDPDDVDPAAVLASVERLRARGARLALDDVGAGGQEFSRLVTLRPDVIKVDRALVTGCAADRARTAVLLGLVGYTRHLGRTLCAEGVENVADLLHLADLGVTQAQGNLLAEPARTWAPVIPLLIGTHRFAAAGAWTHTGAQAAGRVTVKREP